MDHYDYIITGAGAAGSSLLTRMMREPFFRDKKILVADQSPKNQNDRTWCFWEKEAGIFQSIVYHRWDKLDFFSNTFSATLDIAPYQYKMIRGIDLYEQVKKESGQHKNIGWRYEKVTEINTAGNHATVVVGDEKISSDYIFNSIPQPGFDASAASAKGKHFLLQHFKGYLIETPKPAFDPSRATFMDFRVDQKHGTTFVYIMPVSPTTALVEYTLFSKELLPQETYEIALRGYISDTLHLTDYRILHEEYGIIPMTNQTFPLESGRVVHMGIAGGQAKGSSGYAFKFIQKRTESIVRGLVKGDTSFSKSSFADKKFQLYDSVLLNVLANHKMEGAAIFAAIFQKNPPDRVLRFLDNESGIADDLQIMQSVPTRIFLPAAIRELWPI